MNLYEKEKTKNYKDNKKNKKHKKINDNVNNNDSNSGEFIKGKQHKDALNAAFIKSIKLNKWFYFSLFVCFSIFKFQDFILLSKSSTYTGFVFSFLFILILGHLVHRLSHNINFTQVYDNHKKNNMNPYIDSILSNVCTFLDFHRTTHHNSDINKKTINIFYEFINNFLTQGGILIIFIWFCNRYIDMRVVLLWALMYATAHNINYMIIKPTVHRDHHLHDDTNYGLDIADIIFDTKFDIHDVEDHNHISINLIVITLIIILFDTASLFFTKVKHFLV